MSLILRQTKGSKLTIQEMDGNFTYLEGLIGPSTLEETLSTGNTSGTYSVIMGTNTKINTANGNSELTLDYGGSAGELMLGNDNSSYNKEQLYIADSYIELSSYSPSSQIYVYAASRIDIETDVGAIIISDDRAGTYNSPGIDNLNTGFFSRNDTSPILGLNHYVGFGFAQSSSNPNDWNILTVNNNIGRGAKTNGSTHKRPILLSCNANTIVEGVSNSVSIGNIDSTLRTSETTLVGNLQSNGALYYGVTTLKNLNETVVKPSVTPGTDVTPHVVYVDVAFNSVTIDLPSVNANDLGLTYIFKDITGNASVNNITLNPEGSGTIDGQSSYIINQNYGSVQIVCNGSQGDEWFIIFS